MRQKHVKCLVPGTCVNNYNMQCHIFALYCEELKERPQAWLNLVFTTTNPPPLSPGPSRPSMLTVWMSKKGRATVWDLPLLCLDSFICLLASMLLDNGEQNQLISKTAVMRKSMWQAVFSQVRTLPMAASPACVPYGAVFNLNTFLAPLL